MCRQKRDHQKHSPAGLWIHHKGLFVCGRSRRSSRTWSRECAASDCGGCSQILAQCPHDLGRAWLHCNRTHRRRLHIPLYTVDKWRGCDVHDRKGERLLSTVSQVPKERAQEQSHEILRPHGRARNENRTGKARSFLNSVAQESGDPKIPIYIYIL